MFNLATNAPPEAVEVNGGAYFIDTDFRVWIEVMDTFMYRSDDAAALLECVQNVFLNADDVLSKNDLKSVLGAMLEFLRGYPVETFDDAADAIDPDDDAEDMSTECDYDFKYDLNWIILAIRDQSGIDLSYKCPHFHWWLFLLEFQNLNDSHYISQLRKMRSYSGEDKELLRLKQKVALPVRYTAAQKKEMERFESLFE